MYSFIYVYLFIDWGCVIPQIYTSFSMSCYGFPETGTR